MNNDYDITLENLARNVRRICKAQKKSQLKLSYEADVDRTYIGYIKNKKYSVSLKVLCAHAKALKVDVEELLKKPPEN